MRWSIPKPYYYASVIATTVGVGCLIKDYTGGEKYKGQEDLKGKVVIVTGANTGIGKEIAHELAARNAKVILACRDREKCNEARRKIVVDTMNKFVYCRECDLASQESIRKFVERFKKENSELHMLVNNGGVMRCPKSYTKEDVLKKSAPSRIINVSSAAHLKSKLKVQDLNSTEHYDPYEAYAQSKLANILFTRELAKRLEGTKITVNAVHPGIVDTEITRHMKFFNSFLSKIIIKPFLWPFIKSPKQGAQTVLYAALDPSLDNVTGSYFSNNQLAEISDEAKDDKLARWLWLVSEKWTKLNAT
ncbi:hypothetical protein KPH14_011775 [Odynerus spinipes]|uniref:Retinol dehydrogenase 13 n=1 Tax=Odynerus spinipes TaxID=1348599 RepID=A0AAD9VTS0_9HYME|nr:hypothetical protein KPH14_011775 [Odynerus spinipes]